MKFAKFHRQLYTLKNNYLLLDIFCIKEVKDGTNTCLLGHTEWLLQ